MSRSATVEIHENELNFSAGHFTIFSATEREDLHGHNYHVNAVFQVEINDNGLAFDYRIYKNKLRELCSQLDRRFLLPAKSKFLTIEDNDTMWLAHFNNEKIPFLKRDVVILPICNATIEELSHWFLEQLVTNTEELAKHGIHGMTISVFNGPSQSGSASWKK